MVPEQALPHSVPPPHVFPLPRHCSHLISLCPNLPVQEPLWPPRQGKGALLWRLPGPLALQPPYRLANLSSSLQGWHLAAESSGPWLAPHS